jgi:predicted CoA-binding protein
MKDISALLDEPETTIAVVGATNDPSKYGNVIYRDLRRKGYKVFPVNRTSSEIEGDQAWPALGALPEKPTIVNIVVPPESTIEVLDECLSLGLTNVWLQPGAESPEIISWLQENEFNYVASACIMIQSRFTE